MKKSQFKKLVSLIVEMHNYDDVEFELNRAYDNGKTDFDTLLDFALGHIKDVGEAEQVVTRFLNSREQGMSNLDEELVNDEESEVSLHNGVGVKQSWQPDYPVMVVMPQDYEAHEFVFCKSVADARKYLSVDGDENHSTYGIKIYEVKREII